ncbi:lysosomal thioesterase PPT2-A-like isoform X2 [Amphiura filiformis]|uniref:lysosomal thioesterase PPT2-A-like isoform X2 n=1 Tax=Amphiura filiformis TaxID=82378 RepID=UPI003B2214A9
MTPIPAPGAATLVGLYMILLAQVIVIHGFKHVVIVHGLDVNGNNNITSLDDLKHMIVKAHPGTNVTIPDLFTDAESLIVPLWSQLPKFRDAIEKVMATSGDGINLICYSQGGILCRALLANMTNHNVINFISLSSPQLGQFGAPSKVPVPICNVYKVCYTQTGQDHISVCNYWNDPHHKKEYLAENVFLPVLNNETFNSQSKVWKDNFLKIKKLILIGGPDDGVITPWQSSHFGFYNENEDVIEMHKQEVFLRDSFGLQTLYNRGAIKMYNISGVEHTKWHGNQTVFDCCIEPYLT